MPCGKPQHRYPGLVDEAKWRSMSLDTRNRYHIRRNIISHHLQLTFIPFTCFLYGNLATPGVLRKALSSREPKSRGYDPVLVPASVEGFRLDFFGPYLGLVPSPSPTESGRERDYVDGFAYEVATAEQWRRIVQYQGDNYRIDDVIIKLGQEHGSKRLNSKCFIWCRPPKSRKGKRGANVATNETLPQTALVRTVDHHPRAQPAIGTTAPQTSSDGGQPDSLLASLPLEILWNITDYLPLGYFLDLLVTSKYFHRKLADRYTSTLYSIYSVFATRQALSRLRKTLHRGGRIKDNIKRLKIFLQNPFLDPNEIRGLIGSLRLDNLECIEGETIDSQAIAEEIREQLKQGDDKISNLGELLEDILRNIPKLRAVELVHWHGALPLSVYKLHNPAILFKIPNIEAYLEMGIGKLRDFSPKSIMGPVIAALMKTNVKLSTMTLGTPTVSTGGRIEGVSLAELPQDLTVSDYKKVFHRVRVLRAHIQEAHRPQRSWVMRYPTEPSSWFDSMSELEVLRMSHDPFGKVGGLHLQGYCEKFLFYPLQTTCLLPSLRTLELTGSLISLDSLIVFLEGNKGITDLILRGNNYHSHKPVSLYEPTESPSKGWMELFEMMRYHMELIYFGVDIPRLSGLVRLIVLDVNIFGRWTEKGEICSVYRSPSLGDVQYMTIDDFFDYLETIIKMDPKLIHYPSNRQYTPSLSSSDE
ncbi:hypothetical protein ABW19_dt0205546 [Dactylella cylindrospora]|nr:hypothetical protein ABW19_dt0205546 [Dactylella cylindrospora]